MNPAEWTNAVKMGVALLVNTMMGLALSSAIFLGLNVDEQAFAGLSLAVDAFVNAALGLWIIITYRQSPARATKSVLESRGLKP
jgi:hypothetical protein